MTALESMETASLVVLAALAVATLVRARFPITRPSYPAMIGAACAYVVASGLVVALRIDSPYADLAKLAAFVGTLYAFPSTRGRPSPKA